MIRYADPRVEEPKPGQWIGPGFDLPDTEPLFVSGVINRSAVYQGRFYRCQCCGYIFSDSDRVPCTADGVTYICFECRGDIVIGENGKTRRPTMDIPPAYVDAEIFDHPTKVSNLLKRWPRSERFVVVSGMTGSGKTHCCWGLVKLYLRNGLYVRYYDCRGLRRRWISLMERDRVSLEDRLIHGAFLILDDLSGANASDGWVELIEGVLDRRLAHNRPTMLTTLGAEEKLLSAGYGDAIISRLSKFRWLPLPAKDYRKTVQKKKKESDVEEKPVEVESEKTTDSLFEEIPF